MRSTSVTVAAAALLLASILEVHADDIPLRRDPADYLVLGMVTTHLSTFSMEPPGCNVGVNCAPLAGSRGACGFFHLKRNVIPEPGQVAANLVCGSRSFFQVFAIDGVCSEPRCDQIVHHGSAPDCTEPFLPPILGDLDGDGIPSCDGNCVTDPGDVAAACGVTLPLPACDPSRPLLVVRDQDCPGGDAVPGNSRCDLPAGVYGDVRVDKGARIVFAPGTTVVCSLVARTATRVTGAGVATILVPGHGTVRFGDSADAGSDCGALRIVTEAGELKLGRFGDYTLDACSVGGPLRLGHGNNLRGHLIGAQVSADKNNDGRCCAATAITTTSTTVSTTSTTVTGSTTTTATQASSTSTPSTTSTTTPASTTTTTTLADGRFTRTPGFYKTHPTVTEQILSAAGGVTVCGRPVTDVHVDHGHSALEALCIEVQGDQRAQLARLLVTAALTMAANGRSYTGFSACDAVCRDPAATSAALASCVDATDAFNESGDNVTAPFDPAGPADPSLCDKAFVTDCTFLSPSACLVP